MLGDGGGTSVVALSGQGLTQPDDPVFDLGAYRVRTVPRSARVWPECAGPFGGVALTQLLHPVAGDVVIAGDLAFAAPFHDYGGDDKLRLRHGRPPSM